MKKNFFKTRAICFISLLIFGTNTYMAAQLNQDTIDMYSMTLQELMNIKITGASRYEQSADVSPNSIIVITEKQIEIRGYQDLSDVLKDVPGFDISDNASRYGEYYTLRGIGGNERFLVMVDGHKINSPTGTLLSIGNSISVGFAKQIEIIYGPASAVFGADAYSGIINIISKDDYQEKINIRTRGSYGSLASTDAMLEGYVRASDDLSFTFHGRMFRSDGFNMVGTDTIYNIVNRYKAPFRSKCEQPINDYSLFFRGDYKNLTFGYFRQMFDEGNALSLNPGTYIYNKENKWKFNTDNIWVTYKKDLGKAGALNADFNILSYLLDNNSQFLKWKRANTPGESFSQYMTGKDLSYKGTVTLNKEFSDKFQYIFGIDYEHIISIPPYANDELLGISAKYEGENAARIDEVLTLDEDRVGTFGQFIWSPVSILDLVIGGRYDYSSRYKGTFNPRAGFTLRPLKKTIVKFVYGQAFQAPSLFYQYEQFGTPTSVLISTREVQKTIPGWELKNQLVSTYEMSISQQVGSSLRFKVAGYYNYLTDLIQRATFDTQSSTVNKYFKDANGNSILTNGVRNENIGTQTVKGFNTEINYIISGRLEAYGYYNYTKAISKETSGEVNIPRVAENKIWIGATVSNVFDMINISPRLRWAGMVNTINTTAFPGGKHDGYTTLDLSVSTNNLFGFMKAYAVFNNLLNQKIVHGGIPGVAVATIPQDQLRFKAGIEIYFNRTIR